MREKSRETAEALLAIVMIQSRDEVKSTPLSSSGALVTHRENEEVQGAEALPGNLEALAGVGAKFPWDLDVAFHASLQLNAAVGLPTTEALLLNVGQSVGVKAQPGRVQTIKILPAALGDASCRSTEEDGDYRRNKRKDIHLSNEEEIRCAKKKSRLWQKCQAIGKPHMIQYQPATQRSRLFLTASAWSQNQAASLRIPGLFVAALGQHLPRTVELGAQVLV